MSDDKETAGQRARRKILDAGLKLWPKITLDAVASEAGMSRHALLYHYGSGDVLRESIVEWALLNDYSPVILQLIAQGHQSVYGMSPEERRRHLEAV